MKTESNTYPEKLKITKFNEEQKCVLIVDMDSVVEKTRDEEVYYEFDAFEMFTQATNEYITEKVDELLQLLKTKEYNDLADAIRGKRNQLLLDSDKYMVIDRLNLDTSSAIKFLASLKNIFANNWTYYRQALRDITSQPNFPYEVSWPQKPE